MKITSIHRPDPTPNEDIINQLNQLMKHAKNGSLQDFAFCGIISDDGDVCSGYTVNKNVMGLVGSLAIVQKRIIDKNVEY